MTDELAVLLGHPRKLTLAGEEVEIRPLRLRQFGQLLGVLPTALAGLFGTFENFADWMRKQGLLSDTGEVTLSGRSVAQLLEPLVLSAVQLPETFDRFVTSIAIASGLPKQRIEELDLADSVRLATVLWEMNADFFVRSVWPAVAESLSPTNGKSSTPSKNGHDQAPAGRASSLA